MIRIRELAKMGNCLTQPFYDGFSSIKRLRKQALLTFIEEATVKTGFKENMEKSSFNTWRKFCDLFIDCFNCYEAKELLLEEPECRVHFYRNFISPFADELLETSDKKDQSFRQPKASCFFIISTY